MIQTKEYDPFHLGLKGISVMGGLHYLFRAGRPTELEVGVAAGWTRAEFDFRSAWSMSIDLLSEGFTHSSVDGGTLEGDGRGDGFAAKGMLRLNRALGRRFGFFVETAATYCRLKSITGTGRGTRLGFPGETTWEGTWGIKKEEIEMSWGSASVSVPTNYWEGWVAEQRERDFVLDLSGLRKEDRFRPCLIPDDPQPHPWPIQGSPHPEPPESRVLCPGKPENQGRRISSDRRRGYFYLFYQAASGTAISLRSSRLFLSMSYS